MAESLFCPLRAAIPDQAMITDWFIRCFVLLYLMSVSATVCAASRVTLLLDDIHGSAFDAKAVKVSFNQSASLMEVRLGEVVLQGRTWQNLQFVCHSFRTGDSAVHCDRGVLKLSESTSIPVVFFLSFHKKTLEVLIRPEPDEHWKLVVNWGGATRETMLTITNGRLIRIAQWLPADEKLPVPGNGLLNGVVRFHGNTVRTDAMEVSLDVDGMAFANSSGLHAGENISTDIHARATRKGDTWQWQANVDWKSGAVFWEPLYFTGSGHQMEASGEIDASSIRVSQGRFLLRGIGSVALAATVDRPSLMVRDLDFRADNLDLAELFSQVFKPFLVNTSLAEVKAAGHADVWLRMRNGISEQLTFKLRDASLRDQRERFEFHGIHADIPWQAQGLTIAGIDIQSGHVFNVPFGKTQVPLHITGTRRFDISKMTVPVLDGALVLDEFSALYENDALEWVFSGQLLPVSMQKLTEALKIQQMRGILSGVIPRASYARSAFRVDGALQFRIFDGAGEVSNLTIFEPMGRAPHLLADVDVRNIDLSLLTGTFSFGNVQGRVDVKARNLELSNWKPVSFEASLASSPGNYPRRISQAAVQNITSLGGRGAAAAVQRSFLRFFDNFDYQEVGLSCTLRKNTCMMDGISATPKGGFYMVKGSGVPAMNVIGYNHAVNWKELVERLQQITETNDVPVVR